MKCIEVMDHDSLHDAISIVIGFEQHDFKPWMLDDWANLSDVDWLIIPCSVLCGTKTRRLSATA